MLELVGTNGVRKHKFDGKTLHVKTVYHDDKSLDINEKIRNSNMLDKGKLGLHDDEDIRMVFSCPSTAQWYDFKRRYPDVAKGLISPDEQLRMSSAKQLQILHPDWCVMERL